MNHNFLQHPTSCPCPRCTEHEQLHSQHLVDAPPFTQPSNALVSILEVLDDTHARYARLTYQVLDDWSDD